MAKPKLVCWHGSKPEANRLQDILTSNCACTVGMGGRSLCAGHDAMVHDQRFIDFLLWERWSRAELIRQEWSTE